MAVLGTTAQGISDFLVSHENAFKTNILNRLPGLMVTMQIGPETRRILNEGVFETLITDQGLEPINKNYRRSYNNFTDFDSMHRGHQNDTKRAFLNQDCDVFQVIPRYLNSIPKNPTAQKNYCEKKAIYYLKKLAITGYCVDERRRTLRKKKQTMNNREMSLYEMQTDESFKFLAEITTCLKRNLDQLMKIPCIPIFLKNVKDAHALDGINRYPELKEALKKVKGNIRKPQKHANLPVEEISPFESAMDYVIPSGGYWNKMDEDIVEHTLKSCDNEALFLVEKKMTDKKLKKITENTSTGDAVSIYLQKLGLLEWSYLLKRKRHLLNVVENTRGVLRKFLVELLNAEFEWMRQFKNNEEIKIIPDLKCPAPDNLENFQIPDELKREITGAAVDVIIAMAQHLRETKPEQRDNIPPIREDLIRFTKEHGDLTQWLYENWQALSPQTASQCQQSVFEDYGAPCNEPAYNQGPDSGFWDEGQILNRQDPDEIETIILSSDTEESGDDKDKNEVKKETPKSSSLPERETTVQERAFLTLQNPHLLAHLSQIAFCSRFPAMPHTEYPDYVHPILPVPPQYGPMYPHRVYPVPEETPVPAHLIPAPLQPGEKEKYAHIVPHRVAPPPPVQQAPPAPTPYQNSTAQIPPSPYPLPISTDVPTVQWLCPPDIHSLPQTIQSFLPRSAFLPNYSHVPAPTSAEALLMFLSVPANPDLVFINHVADAPRVPEPHYYYHYYNY